MDRKLGQKIYLNMRRINALGDKTAITPNLDELVKNGTSYMKAKSLKFEES